ncbi:MAG: molybdopterin-dependent oxidoreductase, partial [Halodesulfurarchaeum sp.]
PVRRGIDALVAYLKDGRPIAADHDYPNRFVSPSLDGTRDVKGVSRIDHRALEPGDDPASLEDTAPDGDRFEATRFDD